jgi:hypothetical protein
MRGIGSMLHQIGGGSPEDPKKYYGKKIICAKFENDSFYLEFEDGSKIRIWDDGQSCCESRYMTCDDDPKDIIGHTLRDIEIKKTDTNDDNDDWGGCHEIAFLEIQTDKGSIQFATHNEHNGYYGGFGLSVEEVS